MIQTEIPMYNVILPNGPGGQQAFTNIGEDGIPYTVIAFKPSKEDIEAMQRGEPVYVRTFGNIAVPLILYTCNEKGELNI